MYKVTVKKKVLKKLPKLPSWVILKFEQLVVLLEDDGPIQPSLQNYSQLGSQIYHCHLGYSWVACWKLLESGIEIEVYYVGSRENAPY